jgi:hypothetical protein
MRLRATARDKTFLPTAEALAGMTGIHIAGEEPEWTRFWRRDMTKHLEYRYEQDDLFVLASLQKCLTDDGAARRAREAAAEFKTAAADGTTAIEFELGLGPGVWATQWQRDGVPCGMTVIHHRGKALFQFNVAGLVLDEHVLAELLRPYLDAIEDW